MQGILAAAQHSHIFATVEKRVAGGAVAHAVALQPGQPWDAGSGPGSSCCQNDGVCRVIAVQRFDRQLIGISQANGLGGDEFHAYSPGTLHAPALQLCPRDGLGKAVVILDELGAVQGARALGQDGGVHACPRGVQCSRYARRAGTDNDNVRHLYSPFQVRCLLTPLLYTKSARFP